MWFLLEYKACVQKCKFGSVNQLPKFGMAHLGAIWQKRAVGNPKCFSSSETRYPWKHFGEHPKAAQALGHSVSQLSIPLYCGGELQFQ